MQWVTAALAWAPILASLLWLSAPVAAPLASSSTESALEHLVTRHITAMLPTDGAGGAAVAVLVDGRTSFFNYGWAELAGKRPVTPDTLFNLASLRKVFEATVLAEAVRQGGLRLDDPAAMHVRE